MRALFLGQALRQNDGAASRRGRRLGGGRRRGCRRCRRLGRLAIAGGQRRASCELRPGRSWCGHAGSFGAPDPSRSACAARACRRCGRDFSGRLFLIRVIGHLRSAPSRARLVLQRSFSSGARNPQSRRASCHEQRRQPPAAERGMDGMLAPECRAQFGAAKATRPRGNAGARAASFSCPSAAAVGCFDEHRPPCRRPRRS